MEIRDLLMKCGISPAHKGYRYLAEAVEIRMNDENLKLVHGVFVRIGMRHSCNYKAVERCCRHALKSAADSFGTYDAARVLGRRPASFYYTANEFISLAAIACSRPAPLYAAGF